MIKTNLCEEDSRIVIYIEGRVDTPDADKLKKDMAPMFECHDKDFVIDLTDLKYICSAGLRLFLMLLHQTQSDSRTVTVTNLSPYIRKVFDETGFTRLFKLDEHC